jgi:NADH-quinone oxidoreductase subunit M
MGGFWTVAPRLSSVGLIYALASLGLPGFGNFVGEFLVLLGSYRVSIVGTVLAATALVLSALYSLWFVQRVFHGENQEDLRIPDLSTRETAMMAVLIVVILWIGLHPQPLLNMSDQALNTIAHDTSRNQTAVPGEMR